MKEVQHLAASVFGNVEQPKVLNNFGTVSSGGIGVFVQLILNILFAAGAIYALFNFALAGYGFLSAGNDPKKMQAAWGKIWQTVLGLALVLGIFVLAAIVGRILTGNYRYFLMPRIPIPTP